MRRLARWSPHPIVSAFRVPMPICLCFALLSGCSCIKDSAATGRDSGVITAGELAGVRYEQRYFDLIGALGEPKAVLYDGYPLLVYHLRPSNHTVFVSVTGTAEKDIVLYTSVRSDASEAYGAATLVQLARIKLGTPVTQVLAELGPPSGISGSGSLFLEYRLPDSTTVGVQVNGISPYAEVMTAPLEFESEYSRD